MVFTGALIFQPPRELRDDPQVLNMLERMQAAHNGIRPQPVRQSHPVQIVKNKAGAIREVRLYLEDEEFTVHNDFLERMTRLPSLETLIIQKSKIDNDGLRSIRKMPSLKMLVIQNSPITDRGLRHLVGLANLEQIGFYQTGVTYEYVRKFHKQIPHIEFLDSWCCGCMSFDPITRQSARD